MHAFATMGQITLILRLSPGMKLIEVPFQVVPTSVARYRFDALLSGRLIKQSNILMFDSRYFPHQDEKADSEDSVSLSVKKNI
jgi:hypothetical protein